MGHTCLSIKSKAMESVYMMEHLIETVSPYMIKNICSSNFQLSLQYGCTIWGGNSESNTIFNLQKKVLQIISGVSNCTM
jgi:hypothetical protein